MYFYDIIFKCSLHDHKYFFEWIIFSLTNNNNSEILQYNNISNNIFINYGNFLGSYKLKVIF